METHVKQKNMWNMFKVNNKDTKTSFYDVLLVFLVNFEQILLLVPTFQLLTLNMKMLAG